MITVPVRKAEIDYDYEEFGGFRLTIDVGDGYTHSANTIKKMIDSNMPLELTLKKPSEDKTAKQLGAAWAAMTEMGKALEMPVNEVYHLMVLKYGKSQMVMVPNQEAEKIINLHTESGNGNFGEIVGKSKIDPACTVVKLYWGCSYYDKEEMSSFLNGIDDEHTEMFE